MELDSIFDIIEYKFKNVTLKIYLSFIIVSLLFVVNVQSQKKVTAKKGDGIYSLLRREGINPVKYYVDFVELNKESLVSGSNLKEGVAYILPEAKDSFKSLGVEIQFPEATEKPIFDEVAKFVAKDSTLKNTVYYLISNNILSPYIKTLTKRLILKGAKVYTLYQNADNTLEKSERENLGTYVDVINKKYLMHRGRYQRVLVINGNSSLAKSNPQVTIYHHEGSEDGEKLAESIQKSIKATSVTQRQLKNSKVLADGDKQYFAKNILPTVTFVEIGKTPGNSENTIKSRVNKKNFTSLITKAILTDYSNANFEDED